MLDSERLPSSSTPTLGADSAEGHCTHCGEPLGATTVESDAHRFCCMGCRAAHAVIHGSGLQSYYARRCIDPQVKSLRPDDAGVVDFSAHVHLQDPEKLGGPRLASLHLMVEGLHCAACVWLIETLLARDPSVQKARVNMTTRRLILEWIPPADQPEGGDDYGVNALLEPIQAIGYRLMPFDPELLDRASKREEAHLMRAMAVAGFASGNVMLFSVSVWFGFDMGENTRTLMHWLSALVAIPAILYAVRPFARSAITALRAWRSNMDVPITVAVFLAAGVSLWETARGGPHAYFDASVMLLFFLLIGRFLDFRARGRARSAAEHLVTLGAGSVTVLRADGTQARLAPASVNPGDRVLVAAGERIGVDGLVLQGQSDVDTGLLTGESLPVAVAPGSEVFAGTMNMTGPVHIQAKAVGEGTVLSEIVRLMEGAEQGRARYVAVADRVARGYVPVVHLLALTSFFGWIWFGDMIWQEALMIAAAVLIVTCPCALALAVPVVQVVATGRLMRRGILVKSPTALERLTTLDHVVFDKTGTLTKGVLELVRGEAEGWSRADLDQAARMARSSRHPLARALADAAGEHGGVEDGVVEHPGQGLSVQLSDGTEMRLGARAFCGVSGDALPGHGGPELWLAREGRDPVRFRFLDQLRPMAIETMEWLRRHNIGIEILSGDRTEVVAPLAAQLGVTDWQAGQSPADKAARLEALAASGRQVLMVGDGLNDAPALASAHVSLSPSAAADITRNSADLVFQGERLSAVTDVVTVARKADQLVKQNFVLSFAYNVLTVPLAVAGFVTPLIAAVAMSASSVAVIVNALRLARDSHSTGTAQVKTSMPVGPPQTSVVSMERPT